MRRLLVTGANGFIGRRCLPLLKRPGDEIHAVHSPSGEPVPSEDVIWHVHDLVDPGAPAALIATVHPTHLLHLAWSSRPGGWASSGEAENLAFVSSTLDLFRSFVEAGGARAVFAGSCTEYDWSEGRCSETTPRRPATFYGACKSATGDLVTAYARATGVQAAWARIFFVFGPHEDPARLIPSVAQALLRREEALCSHGTQRRDFLFVDDVASALVRLLDSTLEGAMNIGSGVAPSVREIAEAVAARIGRPDLLRFGAIPAVGPEASLVVADTSRLAGELGWRPAWEMGAALDETVRWWRRLESRPNVP